MNYSNANKRQTRKEKRKAKYQNVPTITYDLKEVTPLTVNQQKTFDYYKEDLHLMLHGCAGTGKTFLSLYLALEEILTENSKYKKIYIVRSVVPTRDIGFLPGTSKEKAEEYEAPYISIFKELFNKSDAYDYMKKRGLVEFITTSFLRGITLNDAIVITDEFSNCTLHELDSVITRVGKNCKLIFVGDFTQSDFNFEKDKKGIKPFMNIIKGLTNRFAFVEFEIEDIVRSGLVKDYIIEKYRIGIST
jgi:phosphate starvation-inducible protein PhoH